MPDAPESTPKPDDLISKATKSLTALAIGCLIAGTLVSSADTSTGAFTHLVMLLENLEAHPARSQLSEEVVASLERLLPELRLLERAWRYEG